MFSSKPVPFASSGVEKMVYDNRMGPQSLWCDEKIFTVYHASNATDFRGHPHIINYNISKSSWSEPVQIGTVQGYDHHFAPVLWRDFSGWLHVLYNCHGRDGGIHLVSKKPEAMEEWEEAPSIASSVSYPRIFSLSDQKILIYFRTFGHMGYWGYQISNDGGFTWRRPLVPLVDFDQNPQVSLDTWACTYHSVQLSPDKSTLHISFCYMDERKSPNPVYLNSRKPTVYRYNLYYLYLEIKSGKLYGPDGIEVHQPVNRASAESCKIWNTEHRNVGQAAILVDKKQKNATDGSVAFIVPVSGNSPAECAFYFVRRKRGVWDKILITETNDIWSGSHVARESDGTIVAYLTVGIGDASSLRYGGGLIEEWRSNDEGETWVKHSQLVPDSNLLYNNPKPVEFPDSTEVPRCLTFFGWQGPEGLETPQNPDRTHSNNGRAYLWNDGDWL